MTNIMLSAAAWVTTLRSTITSRIADERGQDLIEYAVLVGAIGVVAFAAFAALPLGVSFTAMGTRISDCVTFNAAC